MHYGKLSLLTAVALLCAPASASAAFAHSVAPGESLASVAAADGLSVATLAAANGISPDSLLIVGATLQIPPQDGGTGGRPTADPAAVPAAGAPPAAASAPGQYTVQPGDTLTDLAARWGTTVQQLAAADGLDPAAFLVSGTSISPAGPASSSAAGPSSAAGSADAGAQPTSQTVSAADIGSVAAANGVPPSLAEAIGYQESGFNNALVSSTGAAGVMQIEPGTWNYIGRNLAGPPPLSASSAQDNIRGGVLLLQSLLSQTGGDPALAAAGYYQGLRSVRQNGMYADTRRYVANVLALRQRFGSR